MALLFLTGPLVEMGVAVVVVCAVAMRSVVGLEGESWVGVAVGNGDAVAVVFGGGIGVACVCALVIGAAGS